MSSDWVIHRLENVVSLKTGKLDSNAAEKGGIYPFFTCSPTTSEINTFAFDTEAVILAGNNANGVFSTKYYSGKFNAYQRTYVIEPLDPELVSCKYMYYVISDLVGHLKELSVGTATKFLTKTILNELPIPLPPKSKQDEIAELLSALDDRITLLHETSSTLEAIAQALFKSWFVDFDPVYAKADELELEGIDTATAELFPDSFEESELGLVPLGWNVDRAGSWLNVLETGRRPKGGVAGITDGIPSIGAESIVRIGAFDYSKTKYVPADFFEKMKSGELQSHDVLLYKDGGKPGVFLPRVSMFGDGFPFEKCGINEHVFRIRLKEPFCQVFLYYWLWSDAVMHELKHRGGKAAIPGINQSDVKELKLIIPDTHVLTRFNELTSPLISTIFSNSKQAQTLIQLRNTLLPRLISGQLCLSEASVQIEAVCA